MHNILSKIKEAFTFEKPSDYIWECIDCKEKFDGANVELFIKTPDRQ